MLNLYRKSRVKHMGTVTVKFLGEEYQISEAVRELLEYDQLLTPIYGKIVQCLRKDIQATTRTMTFDESVVDTTDSLRKKYQGMMMDCANTLVSKCFSLGVYDITPEELVADLPSIRDINKLTETTCETMLAEGRKYVNNANTAKSAAYDRAASNITGSGVTIFTSSLSTLLLYSTVESQTLMSQAKKADKEYQAAVNQISKNMTNNLDSMVVRIMLQQYFPAVMGILLDFSHRIMVKFLSVLTERGKFDFQSISQYDKEKAERMLENIHQVPDKAGFLKQTFTVCPFCPALYNECLNQGLLDFDTLKTAEYFGFAPALIDKMKESINNGKQDANKIKPMIAVLAAYEGTSTTEVGHEVFADLIIQIKSAYSAMKNAITDNKSLDTLVRENINADMNKVINTSQSTVAFRLERKLTGVLAEGTYCNFVEMGLLTPEMIRMDKSTATDLSTINKELLDSVCASVMEYIEEAKRRLSLYEESRDELRAGLRQKYAELEQIKQKRDHLGIFAFSKKKEMALLVEQKEKEISDYKQNHESNKLLTDFEQMYR